ncbi:MAG: ADP-ribosylglycohydrolase family protein [Saprospiraceae bacterium]
MNLARDIIIGVAVADAVGVPVEFQSRTKLNLMPVKTMRSYGTYNQPKGTWSDDSSLTFCLADSLTKGFDLIDITKQFIHWKNYAKWTPHGEVFDIGITTSNAINILDTLIKQQKFDELLHLKSDDEYTNGNGSLMRISPLYFYLKSKKESIESQFETIWQVSALTHGHIRSAIACTIYLIMMEELVNRNEIETAYVNTQNRTKIFFQNSVISQKEIQHFDRLIEHDISKLERKSIKSDGYVMSSLEAAFWCLLNSKSYEETVLKAVNLGSDTDTTAAIVGGLAGVVYGVDGIPNDWYKSLVKLEKVEQLCDKLWIKHTS